MIAFAKSLLNFDLDLSNLWASFLEFLAHPLVVILVGGYVAAIVGARLARTWEARKAGFDLKTTLINDAAERTAALFSEATKAEMRRDHVDEHESIRETMTEALQSFQVFRKTFETRLRTYFPTSDFANEWNVISESIYGFTHLSAVYDPQIRQRNLDKLWADLDLANSRRRLNYELLLNRHAIEPGGAQEVPFAEGIQNIRLEIESRFNALAQGIIETPTLLEQG